MRVVHETDDVIGEGESEGGETRVLATDVEKPDSTLAHAKGLRFRRDLPEGYAFVMDVSGKNPIPFAGGPTRNVVDMLFMRVPLDVVWLVDEEVVAVERLSPWTGMAVQKADTIIELPAGAADGVEVGDTVRVVEGAAPGDGESTDETGDEGS